MSTSKIILVQKSVNNVSKNLLFRNRWVSINSLFNAVKRSYDFDDDYNINKGLLTKSIGKMVTSIDNLDVKNDLGMFRGKKNNEYFLFFQDAWKDPPSFPKPKKFGTKSKKLTKKW